METRQEIEACQTREEGCAVDMTCGNCGHCADRHGNYSSNDGVCLRIGVSVRKSNDSNVRQCGTEWVNGDYGPAQWVERTETAEQRYEELSQVARDMYRYMDGVLNKNWAYSLPSDTDAYKDALEALGVSLDD